MGEIRNQLKSQSLAALLPTSIEQVGGAIFPDTGTIGDQMDLTQIIQAYSSVHSPTYGSPIGSTGATNSVSGAETLLSMTKAQVAKVETIQFTNGGGAAPILVGLTLGGVALPMDSNGATSVACGPSESIARTFDIHVDVNTPLVVVVASGTASDLTSQIAYIKTSQ